MSSTVVVQARVPEDLKKDTDPIFSSMGMDTATGIRMFLAQVRLHNGMPFEVTADPFWSDANQRQLRKAVAQVRNGQTVHHDIVEVGDA